ncbi:MAG: hypothetical protein M3P85_07090 [Actinomycetota bacterium]|nr:hypothetical protein [Actinomycetota bacterium]
MTEPRSPVDQALDLFVFAPLGLALAVREELPRLIEKGRSRTDPQVALARMVGQLAVGRGQQEAGKALNQLWSRLGGGGPAPAPPAAEPPAASRRPSPGPPSAPSPAQPAPTADELAIPGYNALSAPQVVQRLSGLSPDELDAVGAYEAATRHRQTILGRIAQLRSHGS